MSPLDKNGADIEMDNTARAAAQGDAVTFTSLGNFSGGGKSGGFYNQFVSVRTAAGWETQSANPPFDAYAKPAVPFLYQGVSEDATRGVVSSYVIDEQFGGPLFNLFLFDAPKSSFSLLSRPDVPIPSDPPQGVAILSNTMFAGASRDFSHIVFQSHRAINSDAPLALDGIEDSYLYEWVNGTRRLVSVLPKAEGGAPFVGSVALGRGSVFGTSLSPGPYAISADGSRIFFSTDLESRGAIQRLYLREQVGGGAVSSFESVRVNASERTDCAGDSTCGGDGVADPAPTQAAGAFFQLADSTGSTAFFTTVQRLTDDASSDGIKADLYRWNRDAPEGHRLTNLTSAVAAGGEVLDVVGGADDASLVYFVARADLADGAVEGEPNLYVWRASGGIEHIATLDGSPVFGGLADQGIWSFEMRAGPVPHFKDARVTPSGKQLLFRSRAQNTDYDTAGTYQLYLYDADLRTVRCVSCSPLAARSTGDAWLKRRTLQTQSPLWLMRNMSDDGSTIFFDTAAQLSPVDTNGRVDVYEWHNGTVSLVSGGQSADDSAFVDASADGEDVFFATRERLGCKDHDTLIDVYDARAGGAPDRCESSVPCDSDSCQGPLAARPAFSAIGSSTFIGPSKEPRVPRARGPPKCKRTSRVRRRIKGKIVCVKRKHHHRRRSDGPAQRQGARR